MGRVNSPIPVRKLAAGNDTYQRGFHKGNPSGLDAVDADLAVGNIADGVTIFGKLGTYTGGALVEDLVAKAEGTINDTESGGYRAKMLITTGQDYTVATTTPTFAAGSLAAGVGCCPNRTSTGTVMKLRLYMGGVQVAESAYYSTSGDFFMLVATRALSGAQEIKTVLHNYTGTSQWATIPAQYSGGRTISAGVATASITK